MSAVFLELEIMGWTFPKPLFSSYLDLECGLKAGVLLSNTMRQGFPQHLG